MTQTFTPEAIIRHLYCETTESQRAEFRQALKEDFFLREEYQILRRAYQELPKVKFYPSVETLRQVLDYSALPR